MAYDITLTSPTYNASGKFGQSLNGGKGVVTGGYALFPQNGTFTVEGWVKQATNPGAVKVAFGSNFFYIACDASGNLRGDYGSGGTANGEVTLTTSSTICDGAWHHIQLVLDASGGKLFRDGVLVASNTKTMAQANAIYSGDISIRAYTIANYDWPGEVDEVAAWSTARNTSAFTPPTSAYSGSETGLLGLWHLDGNGTNSQGVAATAPATMIAPTATAGNASATVTLTAPSDGGSAITGYTVTSSPAGGTDANAGTTSLTHTITGLTNGVSYTFTATATNGVGTSSPSPASNSVTPANVATVPGAPTIGTAVAGNGYVDVAFSAPASNGGASITSYTATLSTGETAAGTSSPIRVTAANGTARTAHVTATNSVGTGPASAESNSVTPTAPASLTTGVVIFVSATNTTINMSCSAASGGTGPYTYQWYRSSTSGFTPGAGNLLAGATSLTLADSSGLSADVPYFYVCRATDAASAVVSSVQVAGVLKAAQLNIGFIGDSNTFGYGLSNGTPTMPDNVATILSKTYKSRAVACTNRAISGTKSPDWISGSANLTNAKTAFAAAGVTHVHYAIGTNDAIVPTSAASYKSNVQSTVNDLVAAGYKVILSYPVYSQVGAGSTTGTSIAYAQQYLQQVDSLINGTTILRGDTLAYNYFIDNLGEFQSDKLHLTASGAISWATMISRAIDRAVLDTTGAVTPATTSRTVTVTLGDASGPLANLTGLSIAFYDQSTPGSSSAPMYKTEAGTTDASGVLTFSVQSTLGAGSTGRIEVKAPDGRHYNGPVVLT